jgi:hypothetical protein
VAKVAQSLPCRQACVGCLSLCFPVFLQVCNVYFN